MDTRTRSIAKLAWIAVAAGCGTETHYDFDCGSDRPVCVTFDDAGTCVDVSDPDCWASGVLSCGAAKPMSPDAVPASCPPKASIPCSGETPACVVKGEGGACDEITDAECRPSGFWKCAAENASMVSKSNLATTCPR